MFATAKCSSESEDLGMEQLSGGTKAVMKMVEYLDSGKNYKIFFRVVNDISKSIKISKISKCF